ncbi:MAG: hypothetical protein FWD69_09050, partial [Polyangiaceae bacterium]|nr:hypothetical protein [Polyangiaceae bacterium]
DETGIDCGGPTAPNRCDVGQGCVSNDDCDALACDVGNTNLCLPASHTDDVKNLDETGIDCGGPTAPNRCDVGQGCVSNDDCNNVACDVGVTNLCLPPSATDGFKNGTETDVDCGGGAPTNAPPCAVGKKCGVDNDCSVHVCNYTHACVEAPSCRQQHGGDTCGAGETGHGETHESCCASLPLPGTTTRVDKYEITAGRVREFLRVVGNNVQGWWNTFTTANPASPAVAQIRTQDVQYLPTGLSTPVAPLATRYGTANTSFGVYQHLGEYVFFDDQPSTSQGCWIGTTAASGYGHPTYWFDDATRAAQFGSAPRVLKQNDLDEKSLNCVTQILLAAFCAWDGGRLPTQAELSGTVAGSTANSAWGAGSFPWGNSPSSNDTLSTANPGRQGYSYAGGYYFVPMTNPNDGTINFAASLYNTTNWNPSVPAMPQFRYTWPLVDDWAQADQAFAISAPGRMVNDKHANPNPGAPGGVLDGWFDLAANLMEMVADGSGTSYNLPQKYWVGGSWEGHGVSRNNQYAANILTKYGKTGGRCAR